MVHVSVLGIGCRLPSKLGSADQLWDFLFSRGTDGMIDVPADRWGLERSTTPDRRRLLDPGLYMQSRATPVKSDLGGEYSRRKEGHVDTIQAR
jgi:hypothetical protein